MMNCVNIINIECNSFIKLQYVLMIWIMAAANRAYPEQQVTLGTSTSLPCDISAPGSSNTDSVTLILWYKGQDISGAPLYSVDARSRNTPLESAKHFMAPELEGRANFDISVRPAVLKLNPIIDTDGGQYWCRVDFRWTRTTISTVPLTVIVPPKRVIIRDENGSELKSVAVFDEGSDVRLFCESIGGNPLPSISWYRNNRKLKTQTVMIRDNNTVVSGITLEQLARGDINTLIKCQATNSELTKPVSKTITIDMNLRPLKAHILGLNRDRLTAGRKLEAICQTYGSRPSAVVNWFINHRKLTDSKEIYSDGNGTKSVVSFVPTPEDNGSDLRCRAENPKLANSVTEDRINLDVKFQPNATLTMGSATSSVTVNESHEILLECNVSSNPRPSRIRWEFNRKELTQDVVKGIIITNGSLIVKNVRQESEGRYQCVAYNIEGRGDSNELFVHVFYAPKCVTQQRVVETSLAFPTNIFCQVEANPENVTFVWESANIDDRRRVSISSKAGRSKLSLVPQTPTDFGLYTCWAHNSVGNNRDNPCVFNVTDSGQSLPKPVNDCRVNTSYTSVYVKCSYSGASQQIHAKDTVFHLEVRDSQHKRLMANQSNPSEPVFNVTDIEWAPIYQLIVFVTNAFGHSNEVRMMVQTELPALKSSVKASPISPNSAQTQQTNSDLNSSHKILVILISLLTAVLIILSVLITITIVLCFLRQQNNRKRHKQQSSGANDQTSDGHSGAAKRQSSMANNKKSAKNKNKKLCQMSATKSSDDSIATSDGSAHPDLIPCDGSASASASAAAAVQQLFYSNDHNIIDDNACDNTYNANNSLSMYRDIIISGGAAVLSDIDIVPTDATTARLYNERRIVNNKNLLTNHTNRVSVINERQHNFAHAVPLSVPMQAMHDNVLLVQTHPSQPHQPLDTFLNKYPAGDQTNDIEGPTNYLHLSATFPQTTPV